MQRVLTTISKQQLNDTVYSILKEWHNKEKGWWYGYTQLMIQVKERLGKEVGLSRIKKSLSFLYKEGKVTVQPIYKEDSGLLNGSGYFYINNPVK